MTTQVVNLRGRKRGSYEYIGRGSIYGNPFVIGRDGEREEVIEKHQRYFYTRIANDIVFLKAVLSLKGKVLGCFCKPLHCHGDTIVEYLERPKEGCCKGC